MTSRPANATWVQGQSNRPNERLSLHLASQSDASSESDTVTTDVSMCHSEEEAKENTQYLHNYHNMQQANCRNRLPINAQFKRKAYGEEDDQDSFPSFPRYHKMGRLVS